MNWPWGLSLLLSGGLVPMMDRGNVILVWVVVQELQGKEKTQNILWLSSSTIVLLLDVPQKFLYEFPTLQEKCCKLDWIRQRRISLDYPLYFYCIRVPNWSERMANALLSLEDIKQSIHPTAEKVHTSQPELSLSKYEQIRTNYDDIWCQKSL